MSYTFTDGRSLEGKEVITFPLAGGKDLITDKLSVSPGTLQECLNYEVTSISGYSQSEGIIEYGLVDYHIPYFTKLANVITQSDVALGIFEGGVYPADNGAKVKILFIKDEGTSGGLTRYSVRFRVVQGSVKGSFTVSVNTSSLTATYTFDVTNQEESIYAKDSQEIIEFMEDFTVSYPENTVPGIGPINGTFFLDDRLYAVRDVIPELVITLNEAQEAIIAGSSIVEGSNVKVEIVKNATIPGAENIKFYAEVISITQPDLGLNGTLNIKYLDLADRIKYDVNDTSLRLSSYDDVIDFLELHDSFNADFSDWYVAIDSTNAVNSGAEDIYAVFDTNRANHGLFGTGAKSIYEVKNSQGSALWRESKQNARTRIGYWEKVDLGKEIQFDTGTTIPLTSLNRTFISDETEITDIGPFFSEIQESTGWRNKENVQEIGSPESWAFEALSFGSTSSHDRLRFLPELTLKDFGIELPSHTVITGITAKIRMAAYQDTAVPTTTVVVRDGVVTLGAGTTSVNKAKNTQITIQDESVMTFTEYVYGGPEDLWGMSGIPIEVLESEDFSLNIKPSMYATDFNSFVFLGISYAEIIVHLQDGTEKVYFHDPGKAVDVAEADIVNYVRKKGAWDVNDAEGVLTLYNVDEYDALIDDGFEIRTQASGGGNLIGMSTSGTSNVLLPSSNALNATNSKIVTITSNFYLDSEGEALYGATGAGPAFSFNGKYFTYIRIPELSEEKDVPRHIYNNQQHLVLGYPSGQALISTAGSPLDFESTGLSSATEVGFGDKITGFQQIAGAALGVFCESSTHALVGSSAASFRPQPISLESGALEYTVSAMGQPMYCDTRGITNISTTDAFGDFNWGRVSKFISPWLQGRLQDYGVDGERKPVYAMPVKNKNQYRLFFEDGYMTSLTIVDTPNGIAPMITIGHYDTVNFDSKYVPTCGVSEVLSNGKEVNVIGTSEGRIYSLDAAPGITDSDGHRDFLCSFTLNPFNGNATPYTMKYNQVYIHGTVPRTIELNVTAGVNYLIPKVDSREDNVRFGYEDQFMKSDRLKIPAIAGAYVPSLTDGYSLKISSVSNTIPTHTLQAITLRPVITSDKTSTPRSTD